MTSQIFDLFLHYKINKEKMKNNNWKIKFWIPYIAGFLIIPGEKTYLDSDFYKNNYLSVVTMYFLFITYHSFFIILPFILL